MEHKVKAGLEEGVMLHNHHFSWSVCKLCTPGTTQHLHISQPEFTMGQSHMHWCHLSFCCAHHFVWKAVARVQNQVCKTCISVGQQRQNKLRLISINALMRIFSSLDGKKGRDSKIRLFSLRRVVWIRRLFFYLRPKTAEGKERE